MTPKKAETILDELGIEYEKVTMAHCLVIKFKDGNRISFKKFMRNHEKSLGGDVSEIMFSPTPHIDPIEVDEPIEKAETEKIIKKKPRKISK
jgi:hypothetical protein